MKKLLLFSLLALPAFGQVYSVAQNTSLSSTAEVVTVQFPSTPAASTVRFIGADVECSAQVTFTLEINGSAASSTSLAIANVDPSTSTLTSKMSAFHSSNVGTGTVLGNYICPANGNKVIDLTKLTLSYPGNNLTIRTASASATVFINIIWQEIAH